MTDRTRITIDVARREDIPALVVLLQQLFSIEQDFSPTPEKQRHGLEALLAQPQAAHVAVARAADGAVLGMASAQLVISTAEGAPSAWVEDVVVADNYRGRGIGRRLLAAVLAWVHAQGATRAQLLVDVDNAPALVFYDRLGWQATRLCARRLSW